MRDRMLVRKHEGDWFWFCPCCTFNARRAPTHELAVRLAEHHAVEAHPINWGRAA